MLDLRESINIGTTLHLFQRPEKEKENKIHERKGPKHIFLKIYYAEITFLADMYIMKYLFGLKLISTSERILHKIEGKWRRLV